MRVRHKPWAKDYILNNNELYLNNYIEKNDFDKLITNYKTINLEVGCGKGKFIYEKALNNPNGLYVGIEKQASIIVQASDKNKNNELKNLKYYYGDINNLIDNKILKNKVDKIYLNFSDPWPKKRHEKRRLTYKTFLDIYYKLLKDDGIVELKTDNKSLFEYSIISMANYKKWYFEQLYLDLHSEEIDNIKTEYEEKFSQKGFDIKYLKVKKTN